MTSSLDAVENDETLCWSDPDKQQKTTGSGVHVVCQDLTPHEPEKLTVDRTTSYHGQCTAECDYMRTAEKAKYYDGLLTQIWESVPESPNYCCHWRSWEAFEEELRKRFGKLKHVMMVGFKKLVCEDIEQNGHGPTAMVKLEHLLRVIKCFGAFVDMDGQCYTLCKLDELLKDSTVKNGTARESWFAGYMSRAKADDYLRLQDEGTFLVRLSNTIFGAFVLSVVARKGQPPIHYDFQYEEDISNSTCSKASLIQFGNYRKKFPNVQKLIKEFEKEPFDDDYKTLLLWKGCPNLPFNSIVMGYKGRR